MPAESSNSQGYGLVLVPQPPMVRTIFFAEGGKRQLSFPYTLFAITEFTEGKYYLLTGSGEKWSDYDGPFDTAREAVQHMAVLCGEYTTPEMVNSAVLTYFSNDMLDLLKDDNGSPINGNQIYWKNTIWKDGEIIWEG